MFDQRTIRRRRAVLAVFVGLSVALLTAYFGEPQGGVLHALQRGTQAALAPIETGASRALKPVRDLFGWFGDTITAKHDNKKLRNEVQDLRSQLAEAQTASHDNRQLRGLVGLQREANFPHGTNPVGARVIARSPTVWYSSIKIDKGSSDGIRVDQPVIAAGGLAGKVANVTGGTAEITLITDADSAVSAQVMPNGATGIVRPEVGNPNDMLLDYIAKGAKIQKGDSVVTSGFTSSKLDSLFPRGIPIGKVTKVSPSELEQYQRVHIQPYADLRRMDYVQVLAGNAEQQRAQVIK